MRRYVLVKVMVWGALAACSFASVSLFAQSNVTGYIFGQAKLVSGQPASAAQVTITNNQTGWQRALPTKADGGFRFPALPIGAYSLQIEADGYIASEHKALTVSVGVGTIANATLVRAQEEVLVYGSKVSLIDISSTESTTILSLENIERLPVGRNPTDVALLAPGTTQGDSELGDGPLVSFGGASIAENAFYINGMDVTNFRNGLGGSTVPFEFYQEFQVKTGGYGAEFGRSTGGVVNTVTKRGGNKWKFGVGSYYEADQWRETSPDVLNPGLPGFPTDFILYNSGSELDVLNLHAYASGPLIRDHLFIYALVQQNSIESLNDDGPASALGLDQFFIAHSNDQNTFWGAKLDWQFNADHLVEFTAFSDKLTQGVIQEFINFGSGELEELGKGFTKRGGNNFILRYTGYFGPNLTLSALAGRSKYDRTDRSDKDNNPVTFDSRDNAPTPFPTDWVNFQTGVAGDQREMYRFDGEWDMDEHRLRFGLDYQLNTSDDLVSFSGDVYWRYFTVVPGETFQGVPIPADATEVVRERIDRSGGGFEVENTAFYIEDHWQAGDNLVLFAGLRNETFDNKNAAGDTFIKMDNQLAPRLGFSWDVRKDGTAKLFGTAGRYYQPMPSVVNINLSGARFFSEEWFVLNELNPDGSPDKGASIDRFVVSDGEIPNTEELLDQNLKPSHQDEFILGYVFEPAPGWSLGIRGIYRNLKEAIEDIDMSRALNAFAADNGFDNFFLPLFAGYVLTNPGKDAHLRFDLDFDGVAEDIFLSADAIGVPKVDRKYKALEIFFHKAWNDNWSLQGSYTYSQSRGNYEGWTRSDTNQANAALTSSFDFPELTEGANGKLPNDRPHTLKLFGAWEFVDKWQLSGSFLFQSGRPYGALGLHDELPPFLAVAFFDHGELVQRGSRGRTPDQYNLNLGLRFTQPLGWRNGRLQTKLDVFNIFNGNTAVELIEDSQLQGGATNPAYLLPKGFQRPRSVRLSARIDF